MSPSLATFFAGFIGALAPEVVRLYQLRQSPQTFQSWYYAISLVYALLGGFVASIMPGVAGGPLWWAFCVGAGLNAVVSIAIRFASTLAGGASPGVPPAPVSPAPGASGESSRAAPTGVTTEAAPKGSVGDFWRAL